MALPTISSVSQAESLLTSGESVHQTVVPATCSSVNIDKGNVQVKQKIECKTVPVTAASDTEMTDVLEKDKALSQANETNNEASPVSLKHVEKTERHLKQASETLENETNIPELKSDGASKCEDIPGQDSKSDQVLSETKLTASSTDTGRDDNLGKPSVSRPDIDDTSSNDSESSALCIALEECERDASEVDSGSEIPSSKTSSNVKAGDISEQLTTNLTDSGRQTPEKDLSIPRGILEADSVDPVSDSSSSVCTIVSYSSLATKETIIEQKVQAIPVTVPVPAAPSLRNLLARKVTNVTKEGSSEATLNTQLAGNVGNPLCFATASASVNYATGTTISNTPTTSGPSSNGSQPINAKPGLNDFPIPSGFIAAPLDGAFRVTLPDETINKIIEDAIKSAGATLTPKAHEMVKSQLDRISVPREGSGVIKSEVMDEIISEVRSTSDAIISTCNISVDPDDGNLTSSKTRRRNDPFFKLPTTGVRPIRNVQDDGTVTWTCTLCGKTFSRNYTYRRHAETHTKTKPWKCEICSKAFTDRRYLQKHMRWHTGKNLQYCCECGRAFSDELAVSKHMRVHNSVKSYACKRCPKVFADAQTLKRHNLHVHDQVKSHKCELCNLSFVFKSHLDDHMKRHTGEKPHKCSICGKGFIQVGTRNRHERQHKGGQGGNPYKCAICKNVFWFKDALRNHFYSMHPDIPVPETHKRMFEEFELAAQHSDISEEETRIRVTHIPRERYPVEGESEDIDSSEGEAAAVAKAKSSNAEQPMLAPASVNGNEVEVKGPLEQLLVATGETDLINSATESDSLVVENITEVDSKEHLRKLVQEQEEKDRQAANIGQHTNVGSHSDS
ncbi:MAG: C2H2-type zinc finger protein, partial [Candidatus Thiodiazotropha sp.]